MGELSDQVWLDRKRVAEALGYSESTVGRRVKDDESPLGSGVKRGGKTYWPHPAVEAQRRHEYEQAGIAEDYKPLTSERLMALGAKTKTSVMDAAMNPAMISVMSELMDSARTPPKREEDGAQKRGGRVTMDAMRQMQARLAIAPSPRAKRRTPSQPNIGPLAPLDPDALMSALSQRSSGGLNKGEDGWDMNRELTNAVKEIVERRMDDPVRPDPVLNDAVEALCELVTRSLTSLSRRRYEQRRASD